MSERTSSSDSTHGTTEPAKPQSDDIGKRAYVAPKLVALGSVRDLTLSLGSMSPDGGLRKRG